VTLKFICCTLQPAVAKLAAPRVSLRALREVRSCSLEQCLYIIYLKLILQQPLEY